MVVTNQNIPLIHRKTRQMMSPAPLAPLAWSFVVCDVDEVDNVALYMYNATTHYIYHHDEDGWVQIPSWALVGAFGAWSCWCRQRRSNTVTATTWSTTSTITTTAAISWLAKWKTLRMLTWSQAGKESVITDVFVVPGWTSTITFSPAFSWAVANTDTFAVDTWRFFVMNAGTIASGIFKSYDLLTGTRTTLSNTWLPATWGTDGKLVSLSSIDQYFTGTSSWSNTTTTINCSTTRTTNNRVNYQVRITWGLGIWQTRIISSNTWTQLTVSSAWTTTPDATSTFVIGADEDKMYLLWNNALTMYRYSISANTRTTVSPTVARAGAPGSGMSANFINQTWHSAFDSPSLCYAGRYILTLRWAGTNALDRFDIAWWTAWAWAWQSINYVWPIETFTTGSSTAKIGRYIYIKKDATNRFFKYSIIGNYIEPLNTLQYTDWAAVVWDKIRWKKYVESWTDKVIWLYNLRNSWQEVHRLMLF